MEWNGVHDSNLQSYGKESVFLGHDDSSLGNRSDGRFGSHEPPDNISQNMMLKSFTKTCKQTFRQKNQQIHTYKDV
jgi:hypothetical protein